MLTKEERAEIAERVKKCEFMYDTTLYKVLYGRSVTMGTSFEDDSKAILERLADLIDPTCKPVATGDNIVCSECGAGLYDDDLYCPHCGARVVRNEIS